MKNLKLLILLSVVLAVVVGIVPVQADDVATFYPDAHVESTSVDGMAKASSRTENWDTIHDNAGNAGESDSVSIVVILSSNAGLYTQLFRGAVLFDTSALPDECVISGATLSFYGNAKAEGIYTPELVVCTINEMTTNDDVVAADFTYGNWGTTPLATPIAYEDFNIGTPGTINNFILNETGLGEISKTGISKFGLRLDADVDDIDPGHVPSQNTYMIVWSADKGEGYKPQLVVAYTVAGSEPGCPTGFEGSEVNIQEVNLVWDASENTSYYTVRGSFEGVPSSNVSGYLVYTGTSTNCTITGLDLNSTAYYFSLWNICSGNVSACLEYIEIGGGKMEMEVTFPASYWVFGGALLLLFAAVFFKKLFLYLALIPLWFGVIATAGNIWIESAAGIVLLFAILSLRSIGKKNAAGGV